MATGTVQFVIERNAQGHITAIVENRGLVANDDEEFKRMEARNGSRDLAFSYQETRTTYEVVEGVCTPMKSREIVRRKKNEEWKETEIVVFDTKLCQEIQRFTFKNYRSGGSFDKELRPKMAELFRTHAREYLVPENKEAEFLSDAKIVEVVNSRYRKSNPAYDLRTQVLTAYMMQTQASGLEQEMYGTSAIFQAIAILAEREYHRLGPSIYG